MTLKINLHLQKKVCNKRYKNVPHRKIVLLISYCFILDNLIFNMSNVFTYILFCFFFSIKHRRYEQERLTWISSGHSNESFDFRFSNINVYTKSYIYYTFL